MPAKQESYIMSDIDVENEMRTACGRLTASRVVGLVQ